MHGLHGATGRAGAGRVRGPDWSGGKLVQGQHPCAHYGGGTGLSTQREGLEMLGCYGKDKVNKFAEIIAATILAGDISLASSVMAGDFVASHDQYGRNRP